jgi:hypothetical protein
MRNSRYLLTHQIVLIQIEVEKLASPRSVEATASGCTWGRFSWTGFLAISGWRICALAKEVEVEAVVFTSFDLLQKREKSVNFKLTAVAFILDNEDFFVISIYYQWFCLYVTTNKHTSLTAKIGKRRKSKFYRIGYCFRVRS